jgi:hypothetical protein
MRPVVSVFKGKLNFFTIDKIFFKLYEKISIIAMKSGDKKRGAFFQTLKSQIKSIKNQWFFYSFKTYFGQ